MAIRRATDVFRRRPLGATAGALLLLGAALSTIMFWTGDLAAHKFPQSPWMKMNKQNSASLLWEMDAAWLILISAAACILPLLELLPSKPVKLGNRRVTTKHETVAVDRAAHSTPDCGGMARRCATPFVGIWKWLTPTGGLTDTSLAFLAFYLAWNVCFTSSVLYYRMQHLDAEEAGFASLSRAAQGWYEFAAVTGYTGVINYGITLLPVSRTSSLLAFIGMSYEEALGFHKLAAVMAITCIAIHFTCQFPTIASNGWHAYVTTMWNPTLQPGQWNFYGQLSFIVQLIMALFSLKYFRQNFYIAFRVAHGLFVLVFVFAIVHMGMMCLYYFQLGIILYAADVAHRFTTCLHTGKGVASIVLDSDSNGSERVVFLTVAAPSLKFAGAVPGRFFYVHVPSVSRLEWHPMSASSCDQSSGTVTFGIKVLGSWTSNLHKLAQQVGGDAMTVNLEGPYGYDWIGSAIDRLNAQGQVALVAGNLGIAPLACAVAHFIKTAPNLLSGVHILWCVRDAHILGSYYSVLQSAAACGADVVIHHTGSSVLESPAIMVTVDEISTSWTPNTYCGDSSSSTMTACPHATVVVVPSTTTTAFKGAGRRAVVITSQVPTPAHAKAPESSGHPWGPASSRWHWAVGAILVWLTTAASMAGFLAGLQVCGIMDIPEADLPTLQRTYRNAVRSSYAEANGGVLPSDDFWPPDQVLFGDAYTFSCYLAGQADEYAMYCEPGPHGSHHNPIYEYGHPLPCSSMGRCWTCNPVVVPLLSWGAAFAMAFLAGFVLKRLHHHHFMVRSNAAAVSDTGTIIPSTSSPIKGKNIQSSVVQVEGRPDFAVFLSNALGDEGVLDVYTCGSEGLQRDVQTAFDEHVQTVSSSSAILALKYTIGG